MNFWNNRIWFLILVATILRLVIAFCLNLGNDEVYYWTYAQDLQWNYFDHPPMVAWLIRLTTFNLTLHHEVFVRAGAVISSAICTLLIYKMGTSLYNRRAGWYAALLYTSSFYCSIIAGTFILPDSPQMIFWLWAIFTLIKIARSNTINPRSKRLWCYFGIIAGLCILCKVHGVFLWAAVALFACFGNRNWLRNPWLYIAAMISFVIASPILLWNIQHHFITYTYHGSRVSLVTAGLNPIAFFRELFGEFFYSNPVVFFLSWASIWLWYKNKLHAKRKEFSLLICCSLPLIVVLLALSLFRDTLPHWSGPAYSCLILISGVRLAFYPKRKANQLIIGALSFYLLVVVAGLMVINFMPGTLGSTTDKYTTGKGDVTLDLYGWKTAGKEFNQLYLNDKAKGLMPINASIIINKWFPASHIDFYLAHYTQQETYGIGPLFDLHQYYFYNLKKEKPALGSDAYYIAPSNTFKPEDLEVNKTAFEKIDVPTFIPIYRNGKICKYLLVYRLRGFKG
ncbi:hypothetical protein AQF98_18655 [Pedobacter sp. Hv1]|nr:hypothetical protein AQF98_18655 [Pedobacter sp. Hv1]